MPPTFPRCTRLLSFLAACLAAYAWLFYVFGALRVGAVVLAAVGLVVLAVEGIAWLVRAHDAAKAQARTPDTDPATAAEFYDDARIAFVVVVAVLGLAVRAWDHDARWLDAPRETRVVQMDR